MEKRIYHSKLIRLVKNKNKLVLLIIGLVFVLIVQSVCIFVIRNQERIIVVPPNVRRSFWVSQNKVSRVYLEEMTRFFSNLLLNETPETFREQQNVLLRYVLPESYGVLKARWLREEDKIKQEQISSAFFPVDIMVNENNLTADIYGELDLFSGDSKPIAKQVHYRIHYILKNGHVLIKAFTEEKLNV